MSISERAKPKRPKCHICGTPQETADDKRSVPHLKRYFALIRTTFAHWPERHERQFTSHSELRAFLQMKAGHRELVATLPIVGIHKDRAVMLAEAAIRAAGSYAMPILHKDSIAVFRPKSIGFAKLSHLEAVGLFADIEDVIRAETGLDPAQLMQEHEGAA